jgi:hypothetical protein
MKNRFNPVFLCFRDLHYLIRRALYKYMKTILTFVLIGVCTGALLVSAQELQSVQTTQVAPQQGRVLLDSDSNEAEVDPVQYEEAEGDPGQSIITDEEETTVAQPEWTDLNDSDPGVTIDVDVNKNLGTDIVDIGVVAPQNSVDEDNDEFGDDGSRRLDDDDDGDSVPTTQYNETDLEFIKERAESDEKGGTTDMNIGLGELQENQAAYLKLEGIDGESEENSRMHIQLGDIKGEAQETRAAYVKIGDIKGDASDSDTSEAKKPKEIVVVGSKVREAVEAGAVVRGWDPEKKEARIGAADVQLEEDLVDFAAGILAGDNNVTDIGATEKSVSMKYKVPAKLFGIFNSSLEQETTVTFGDGVSGRVKVKFPWTRFFYRVDENVDVENIQSRLQPEIDDEVLVDSEATETTPAEQAKLIEVIHNVSLSIRESV